MKKEGIVAVDIGTTSVRAILFDSAGRNRAVARRDNPPTFFPDGRVEQSADAWRTHVPAVLRECADAARALKLEPAALSLTAQRSSVIPLDERGEALHPAIMWQDLRTEGLCAAMRGDTETVYRKSGLKITPVFSAVKMRWLKEQRPELYARTRKMAGIQDYVLFLLTGRLATDRCLASRTNLLDLRTLDWDDELIGIFGLDRSLLCDLVDQGSVCGGLAAAASRETGLREGLPVVSAGGDQQCAALGLGLLGSGEIVANTGTGSYVVGHSDRPVSDPLMRVFCNVSALPGSYILEAGALTTGTVYRWFATAFYGDGGFSEADREAAASPPGANGVLVLPHFKGRGAPHWDPAAKGIFYNLTLGASRGDLARAVLEGIALEMGTNIDLIAGFAGQPDAIRSAGGLTKCELFNAIQADVYGRKVVRSAEGEATALGAWMSAAVALGWFPGYRDAHRSAGAGMEERTYVPDAERAALYRKLAARKEAVYEALSNAGAYAS